MSRELLSRLQLFYHSYPALAILTSTFLILAVTIYFTSPPKRRLINAPTLYLSPREQKKRWRWDTTNFLREAYIKFPGQVFQVWTSEGPEVMIPPAFIDEVKGLPDNVLSLNERLAEWVQSRHTTMPIEENQYGIQFAKTFLTRNIHKFLPGMVKELDFVLPKHFQSYEDWSPIEPHPNMIHIISSLTARVFVGSNLCRDLHWLSTIESYAKDILVSAAILKIFPAFLRPVTKYLIPQIWRIRKHNRSAAQIVHQALMQRLGCVARVRRQGVFEESENLVHAVYNLLPPELANDYAFQGRVQLGLAAAAIHTTARLLTNVLFDIAANPEYIYELREEIESVKEKTRGVLTMESLGKLIKLDSFIKETMRMHAGGLTSFRRKVLKATTLSTGLTLSRNTYLSIPSSSVSYDPSIFPSPDTFSPFRHYKLRHDSVHNPNTGHSSSDHNMKYDLTSINTSNLYFGIGRHACPGRFFAGVEAKLVLVSLLERYDFKLGEGESRPIDGVWNGLQLVKGGGERFNSGQEGVSMRVGGMKA